MNVINSLNCNLMMVEMGNFMLFMFYHNLKKVKSKGSGEKHVFDSCSTIAKLHGDPRSQP